MASQQYQSQKEFKSSGMQNGEEEGASRLVNPQNTLPTQSMGNSGTQSAPINLPPQIARLPLPTQQGVLDFLKQQALARNNPAVVTAVTLAQQQLQLQIQQQQEQAQISQQKKTYAQQGQKGQHAQSTPVHQVQLQEQARQVQQGQTSEIQGNLGQANAGTVKKNIQFSQQKRQQHISIQQERSSHLNAYPNKDASMQVYPSNATAQSPSMEAAINSMQLPPMPKLNLPKYQTINYDMPERNVPSSTFWSSQKRDTDTLLYEQIIQRDKANKFDLARENNGCEPFSIYGFSNKEYLGKLWHTLKYYQELKSTRMKSITNTSQNIPAASVWGKGYSGYGNGVTNTVTQVIPESRVDDRPHVYQNKLQVYRQAMSEKSEDLVPIRLEFDHERDKFFLRDTLLWNKNDSLVKIEEFVDDMMRDYRYAPSHREQFAENLTNSMKEQISEYQPNPYLELNQERIGGDDMRINIKLDIVVGHNQLIDQFEWDISNSENCPEEFAEGMCQELCLPGEFVTAIAHSIREQVYLYHKSLALLGYNFDGSVVEDDDIRSRMLPLITVDDVYRTPSDAKVYTPNLLQISIAELERLDRDKDRDTRRKRRQGRSSRRGVILAGNVNNGAITNIGSSALGNGASSTTNAPSASGIIEVSLPDIADIPRTFRTPVPTTTQPGGIDLGPPVGSYQLETATENVARPPRSPEAMPLCHIVDHVPGKFLLISINLKDKINRNLTDKREVGDEKTFISSLSSQPEASNYRRSETEHRVPANSNEAVIENE